MTYLITGASGSVGRSIVAQLLDQGKNVRVVTRDRQKAPKGIDIIESDFTQGQLPREAFKDVRKVFIFPAQTGVAAFLKQIEQASVEHAVVLSSLAAAMNHKRDRDSISALHHRAIEQSVEESGIPFTFLRPGKFRKKSPLLGEDHSDERYGIRSFSKLSTNYHPRSGYCQCGRCGADGPRA